MGQRYRPPPSFYFRPNKAHKPFGIPINTFRNPKLDGERSGLRPDIEIDLRSQEELNKLEAIRHPRERDYYQDHTYYDSWEQRTLEKNQQVELKRRYGFISNNYQINPWIWYPGDTVEVIKGEEAGIRGVIIAVITYKNEIIVQNVNIKDIVVPASDSRPEQIVQREHPISVRSVKHVDPSNGEICEVKIIKVRARNNNSNNNNNNKIGEEEGEKNGEKAEGEGGDNNLNNNNNIEEKRICMPSGVLLPIPPRKEEVITGDPYRDTPYHDATIITYKPEEEEQILISKKLKAMESGFINKLKNSYHFHSKLEQENAKQMRRYQGDVVQKAMGIIINNINNNYIESLDDWWFEELAGHIEKLEEQDNIINSEKAEAREAAFNNINYNNNLNNNNLNNNNNKEDYLEDDNENDENEDNYNIAAKSN